MNYVDFTFHEHIMLINNTTKAIIVILLIVTRSKKNLPETFTAPTEICKLQ